MIKFTSVRKRTEWEAEGNELEKIYMFEIICAIHRHIKSCMFSDKKEKLDRAHFRRKVVNKAIKIFWTIFYHYDTSVKY